MKNKIYTKNRKHKKENIIFMFIGGVFELLYFLIAQTLKIILLIFNKIFNRNKYKKSSEINGPDFNEAQYLEGIAQHINVLKIKSIKFITKKGEEVKSNAELKIANFLYDQKIKYQYEKLLKIGDKKIYPDFYLSDYNIYIEYWGLLENKKYNLDMNLRKQYYKYNGIKTIDLYPNNYKKIEIILKRRFEDITKKKFPQIKFLHYGNEYE